MKYQVNHFEIKSEGQESQQSQYETVIVADIFSNVTAKDLLGMLFNDVIAISMYNINVNCSACLAALEDWFHIEIAPRLAGNGNPFGLDDGDEDFDTKGMRLCVYMQAATVDA